MVSRVLDLLRRPKISIGIFFIITSVFIAESVKAADKVCSQKFPDKCSDRYLCFVSTALDKQGIRNWISTDFNGKYQLEAKQRNLDCNVGKKGALPDSLRGRYTSKPNYYTQCQVTVEQVKKLQGYLKKLDLYAFGIDGIAGKGTITGLKQAKELIGYTSDTSKCFNDKHLADIKQFIQQTACSEGNLRGCTDVEICSRATTVKDDMKYWDRTSDGYLLAIDKGLDCNVDQLESNPVINPTGSVDLQSCSPSEKKYSVSPLADPADLAIREGASVEYPVIENLKKNQRNIAVTGQYYAESFACQEACTTKKFIEEKCIQTDKLWLQVSLDNVKTGWMRARDLQPQVATYQQLAEQLSQLKVILKEEKNAMNALNERYENQLALTNKIEAQYENLILEQLTKQAEITELNEEIKSLKHQIENLKQQYGSLISGPKDGHSHIKDKLQTIDTEKSFVNDISIVNEVQKPETATQTESWIVRDVEPTGYVPLFEFVASLNRQPWTIRGYVDPDSWQSSIVNKEDRTGRRRIEVVPGAMDDNEFEVFKLECELNPCIMHGKFQLLYTGFAYYRLEPQFSIDGYQIGDDNQLPSVQELHNQLIGQKVVHEQPVEYFDRKNIRFSWDPQDLGYPEEILVNMQWEDRSELSSFIKKCFEKCSTLRVFGEISDDTGGHGDITISAHRIEKSKP